MLCLLLTSVLEPVLLLDPSDDSEEAAEMARDMHRRGWDAVAGEDATDAASVEEEILSSPELEADEEPDGPEMYRLDFLVELVYGLDAYTGLRFNGMSGWLARLEDMEDRLADEYPGAFDGLDLEALTRRALGVFEELGPDRAVAELRPEIAAAAERLGRNLSRA